MTLVVVGNGNVSFWLLKKLGEKGYFARTRVVVFAEEAMPAYDRISISQIFDGSDLSSISFAGSEHYAAAGIELHLDDPVVAVDRSASTVRSRSGKSIVYDQLVFATGSRSFLPPLEGVDLPNVFTYRSVRDVEKILDKARVSKSACVVGGGFLGVELVESLQKLGLTSHIIEHNPGLFPRQMDQMCGQKIAAILEKKGVHVHLMRRCERIQKQGEQLLLEFKDKETLLVDMIAFAVGIRPRDELARAAGLTMGPLGGIAVNHRMETSDPKIFAVGECVYLANKIYGLVSPGYQMAEVLASCLMGVPREFTDQTQAFSQSCFGIRLSSFGQHAKGKAVEFETSAGGGLVYRKLILKENRLVGAYGVGDWPEISKIQKLVDRQAPMSAKQIRIFETQGMIGSSGELPVQDWPNDEIVCNCLSLSKGYICQRVAQENLDVEQVIAQTRASTICGQCRPLVAQLARQSGSTQSSPFSKRGFSFNGLAFVSALAVLGAVAFLAWPEIPVPASYEKAEPQLWIWLKNRNLQEITGFSTMGLSLTTLLFSLRKRTLLFGRKDTMKLWYIFHAALGLLSLIAMIVHSGGRIGSHGNAVLACVFTLTIALGGMAGLAMTFSSRLSIQNGRLLRSALAWAHILVFWIYPLILALHIFSSYYYR